MKFFIDTHTHTVASGHAYSTIKEYVTHANAIGVKAFATTDHGPNLPGSCGLFHFYNLDTIPKVWDGVRIYKGIELNITDFNGNVDYPREKLGELDVVIASLHTPCIKPGTKEENTKATIAAMKNPLIKIIGHPGTPSYPVDAGALAKAAKETGTYLEINNKSLEPNSFRLDFNAVKDICLACKEIGHPIVLGSDAHIHMDLTNFKYAVKLLKEVDMPLSLIINADIKTFEKAMDIK